MFERVCILVTGTLHCVMHDIARAEFGEVVFREFFTGFE